MSNLLGNPKPGYVASDLLSTNLLMEREQILSQRGMHYRDITTHHAILLVLPSHGGEYKDEWNPETSVYTFIGHDSTTEESQGEMSDQLDMYSSGKLTENGKFYRAAHEYIDGIRSIPLQVRVYEKIDSGIWFNKGIFNLIDARKVTDNDRTLFKFDLTPLGDISGTHFQERMTSAAIKSQVWLQDHGHCWECAKETGLRFTNICTNHVPSVHLVCETHRGESSEKRGLLG
ncbi:MAG: restriction endonuclease [Candidatus Kaiserbacteria bacterium]|nr:restriction endonuclease [Candidatus Kaiserbacteria bacterium]